MYTYFSLIKINFILVTVSDNVVTDRFVRDDVFHYVERGSVILIVIYENQIYLDQNGENTRCHDSYN